MFVVVADVPETFQISEQSYEALPSDSSEGNVAIQKPSGSAQIPEYTSTQKGIWYLLLQSTNNKKWVLFFWQFGRVHFWRIGHQHPDDPSIVKAFKLYRKHQLDGKSTNQGAETETEVGDGGGWLDGSIPETKSPSTWNSEVGSDELVSFLGTVGRCESFFFRVRFDFLNTTLTNEKTQRSCVSGCK